MARPRAVEPKTTICVKMTRQEKDRLFAVALDVQRGSKDADLLPSEVNLSEFLRQAVFKIVDAYESQVGTHHPASASTEDRRTAGQMTLLQQFLNAVQTEREAEAARAARAAEEARAVKERAELARTDPPLGNFEDLRVGAA